MWLRDETCSKHRTVHAYLAVPRSRYGRCSAVKHLRSIQMLLGARPQYVLFRAQRRSCYLCACALVRASSTMLLQVNTVIDTRTAASPVLSCCRVALFASATGIMHSTNTSAHLNLYAAFVVLSPHRESLCLPLSFTHTYTHTHINTRSHTKHRRNNRESSCLPTMSLRHTLTVLLLPGGLYFCTLLPHSWRGRSGYLCWKACSCKHTECQETRQPHGTNSTNINRCWCFTHCSSHRCWLPAK